MKNIISIVALIVIIILAVIGIKYVKDSAEKETSYAPQIIISDFSSTIDNPYFALPVGRKWIYEAKKNDGVERTEVYVTNEKKMVMGIETTVVWDRVWLNDELIEDTRDWYAQDKEGNVWYFGEETKEMSEGKMLSTKGSWEAGVDGAQPGIIMKGNPQIGETYREEYYKGEAEDMAKVLSLNETVKVPFGNFSNCLKTFNYTPLDPKADEYKFYCKEVGNVALEIDIEDNENVELISLENNATATVQSNANSASNQTTSTSSPSSSAGNTTAINAPATGKTKITEAKAKEIALARVHGSVTDIAIEDKFGKETYVVEVDTGSGPETDVVINIYTGEVLAVEA